MIKKKSDRTTFVGRGKPQSCKEINRHGREALGECGGLNCQRERGEPKKRGQRRLSYGGLVGSAKAFDFIHGFSAKE